MSRCAEITRSLRPCRRDGQWKAIKSLVPPSKPMCFQHALMKAKSAHAHTLVHSSRGSLLTVCEIPPAKRRKPRTGRLIGAENILAELRDCRTFMELHRCILATLEQWTDIPPMRDEDGKLRGRNDEYHPIRAAIITARRQLRARGLEDDQ